MDPSQVFSAAIVPFAFGTGFGSVVRLPSCPEHPCECACNCGPLASGVGIGGVSLAFVLGGVVVKFLPAATKAIGSFWKNREDSNFAAVARAQALRAKK